MADLHRDEVFKRRGAFADVDHPVAGKFTYPGQPFMMTASPWSIRRPAPLLGQHTYEVLTELGMNVAEIDSLRKEGVI